MTGVFKDLHLKKILFFNQYLAPGLNSIVKNHHFGAAVTSPERSLLGHHSSYSRNNVERGTEEEIDLITSQRPPNMARQPPTDIFDDL